MDEPVEVASLVGHSQAGLALTCLGSLLRYSQVPLRLRLHDDGSLADEDRERLGEAFPGARFVSRSEADDGVAGLLASRPALAALRGRNPLFLKLVDTAILAGDRLAYCDTDVLFLRPFYDLFERSATEAAFMEDPQNAYSLRWWQLLRYPRLRPARRLNSGIVVLRTRHYDPDMLEWFARRTELHFAPVWLEQTAWALIAGRVKTAELADSRQVMVATPRGIPGREAVAVHFVSPMRSLLAGCVEAPREPQPEAARIRYVPAEPCGPVALAISEVSRRMRRLLR